MQMQMVLDLVVPNKQEDNFPNAFCNYSFGLIFFISYL